MYKLVRRTASLPFLPQQDIDDAWEEIMEEYNRSDQLISS